ncbi:MAG: hypothetical protein R3B93_13680 [Bacteroidia bacterium]
MVHSALEAFAIASKIGDKVIIMAASTGATVVCILRLILPRLRADLFFAKYRSLFPIFFYSPVKMGIISGQTDFLE